MNGIIPNMPRNQLMDGSSYCPSVKEVLEEKKKNLEKQLEDVDKAISLLNENPKILDTLDALRKVGI